MRYTPKLMRNMINDCMCKVLRPLQVKDLFMSNIKPAWLVDDPLILNQEKSEGKDGKPYYRIVEEATDEEEIDSAIETRDVRNWRAVWWDRARQKIKRRWVEILEEQQRLSRLAEPPKIPQTLGNLASRKTVGQVGSFMALLSSKPPSKKNTKAVNSPSSLRITEETPRSRNAKKSMA